MNDAHPVVTPAQEPVLFSEPGGRWRTVTYGPLLCLIVLILELVIGRGAIHWFGLTFCAALLAGFVALQVVAGRRHVSVELTESSLRQGTETVALDSIARVFPEHDDESWDDDAWQSARALGELTGVPRRRTGIGLKIRGGGMVQAWARDHRELRAQLTTAVEQAAEKRAAKPGEPGKPAESTKAAASKKSTSKQAPKAAKSQESGQPRDGEQSTDPDNGGHTARPATSAKPAEPVSPGADTAVSPRADGAAAPRANAPAVSSTSEVRTESEEEDG